MQTGSWRSGPRLQTITWRPFRLGYTVLAQAAVVVEDVDTERRFDTALLASDTRSAIAAPVFGPEGVRGVLTGQSSMPCAFDSGAVDFIQSLANIVGTALK